MVVVQGGLSIKLTMNNYTTTAIKCKIDGIIVPSRASLSNDDQ